jgi:hypothetical protein
MKKILLTLMAIFAFGLQNVCAQDAPLKIVTNHPDFSIKVKRCAASGKTVIIDLILNNNGTNDVDVCEVNGGGRNSEAYDDEGNIYQSENLKVKIANRTAYELYGSGEFSIPSGVPMRLSIQINNVPQSAESIARLKLIFNCKVWGLNYDKPVRINNIPITRD